MPTYKQGILARKMHHDVDGKKSGCLLLCRACLGGCRAALLGDTCRHVRRLRTGRPCSFLDGDCVRWLCKTQKGPKTPAPRAPVLRQTSDKPISVGEVQGGLDPVRGVAESEVWSFVLWVGCGRPQGYSSWEMMTSKLNPGGSGYLRLGRGCPSPRKEQA